MPRLTQALILAVFAPLPALAQSGAPGIAFVQAPEQSSGMATGATSIEAFARATAQCVAGGALAADCLPTNWCQPAGWSVDAFVLHQEGIHWHEVVCGLANEAVARSVGAAICDAQSRPYIADCAVVRIIDPTGAHVIER